MTPGRCCFQDVRAIRTLTHVETFLESVDISVAPHDHGKRHSRRGSKRDTAVLDPGGLLGGEALLNQLEVWRVCDRIEHLVSHTLSLNYMAIPPRQLGTKKDQIVRNL